MNRISAWLAKPYDPDMDVIHWALFILLVMIVAAGWAHTLKTFARAVE